ncbi:MAG TPA: hypothetical protein VMB46_07310, partial [Methanomassiliicoccales archaeon]|nr:hypothetical protein [Methanomassiliicoccales archaeon]
MATGLQVLRDTVGEDEAMRLMEPHLKLGGVAAPRNALERLGLDRTPEGIVRAFSFVHGCMRKREGRLRHSEAGAYVDFIECPFENTPGFCGICDVMAAAGTETLIPDCRFILQFSFGRGDEFCRKLVLRNGFDYKSVQREAWTDLGPAPCEVSQQERNWLGKAYFGEFWLYTVRALVQEADEAGALTILGPLMRERGMAFGLRHSKGADGIRSSAYPLAMIELFHKI